MFDAKKVDLQTIQKFTLERGEILSKSDPIISPEPNNMTLAQFTIRARFKTDLNYRAFPLDDHMVHIIISNPYLSADMVTLETDSENFTVTKDVCIPNYKLERITARAGHIQSTINIGHTTQTNVTPRALFSLACNRIDIRHFLNIFLPLLLIFFFTLFAFSFDSHEHETTIPTLAAAGVPALLAYRFVIEATTPDVSYFILSDYLFFLFLFLVFMIFIIIVEALHASERIKKMIIALLYACMLLSSFALFYWAL